MSVSSTLIQQAIFLASFQHPLEEKELEDRVNEIIYEFCCSGKKDGIHDEIREFVATQGWHSEINVVNKIESLIKANEVRYLYLVVILSLNNCLPKIDTRFDRKRDPFTSLLVILRFEVRASEATQSRF